MKPNTKKFLLFFNLVFFISAFFTNQSKAQNFVYSAATGSYAPTSIIGRIKSNILVYKHDDLDTRKSEIFVYNDQMHLLHKHSFKSLTPKYASINFINEENSFSAILRYDEKEFSVCELISFDEDANVIGGKVLYRVIKSEQPSELIKSQRSKSFAFVRIIVSDTSETTSLQYYFIKNDSLIHADKITLPFDRDSSRFGKIALDENNLIVPVNTIAGSSSTIALFKINLATNTSINTIRSIQNGYLISSTINLNENNWHYTLLATWRNRNVYDDNKIFVWNLNKDLTDVSQDTLFAANDSTGACLKNIFHYKLNTADFQNNKADIIISYDYSFYEYADNMNGKYSSGSYYPSMPQLFYEGRVFSMVPQKELNGNGYAPQSYEDPLKEVTNLKNAYSTPLNSSGKKNDDNPFLEKGKIIVLNTDSENNIKWIRCLDALADKYPDISINESIFISAKDSLIIIYSKLSEKNKQSLDEIILKNDGRYVIRQLVPMNLKYEYLLNESVQMDSNSIIIPTINTDKLVLAKLTVE